ncbi:hypothetical protein MA16_Dca022306 [Dendrobium catenatum]|uniref:Uncharacterized protein n=1 Tax=Dendrobium catenatum TaxID=906689 RepID=A0A2I0XAZ4_9ASPA|nr:hypothetical protein MA16_Dca022306 [Dendrobium catenatum]
MEVHEDYKKDIGVKLDRPGKDVAMEGVASGCSLMLNNCHPLPSTTVPSAHANASILVIDNSIGNVMDGLDNLDITARLVSSPIPNELENDVVCSENISAWNVSASHVPNVVGIDALCNGTISVVNVDPSDVVGIGDVAGHDGVSIDPMIAALDDVVEVGVPLTNEGLDANNYIMNQISTPITLPALVGDVIDVLFGGRHMSLPTDVVSIGSRDVVDSYVETPNESPVPLSEPVIDVPVSLISSEVLKAQLAGSLETNCLEQNNWLNDYVSSPCRSVGDDLKGPEDDVQKMYNLNVNLIVEKAFVMGGGKRRRRKQKRK